MAKPRVRVTTAGEVRGQVLPALPVAHDSRPRHGAAYMRGGASPFFQDWNPTLREARLDIRDAWTQATARAVDAIQNSGWLAGAVRQMVGVTIGDGLRLVSKPDAKALGWTQDEANAWAAQVEGRFSLWAKNPEECDAGARWTLAQMQDQVLRSWVATGEAFATVPFIKRPGSLTGTKLMLLPSYRVSDDSDDQANIYHGVRLDPWGAAIGYRIQRPGDIFAVGPMYDDIAARDMFGRPQVVHVMSTGDVGRVRGITPLAPILKVIRQYDQLSDATLSAALIQAIFAASLKSQAPTKDLLQSLQDESEQGVGDGSLEALLTAKAEWYDAARVDLSNHGKVAHLFPDEELEFHSSEHPNSTYEAFVKWLLREISKALGLTFEELTGDFTGATYSSVRMATAHNWPLVLERRRNIPGRFSDCAYGAWLEEEIDAGRIPFPGGIDGFVANRAAAVNCDWRGPAKPQADDVKAATAHEKWKKLGVMSDERICADLGYDWEDEYEQIARERAKAEALDLPDNLLLGFQAAPEQNPEPAAPAKSDA